MDNKNTHTVVLTFAFLTPMMGGGVEIRGPQKPCDPVTPIRVASIRGQLRFWWRACNPQKATTVAELREREAALWGSTNSADSRRSTPSTVTITVVSQPSAPREMPVYAQPRGRWEPLKGSEEVAYGAFPLKPPQGSNDLPGSLHSFESRTFTLCLRCPQERYSEVLEAVYAWSLFGGLGGRTRRGFGAIELTSIQSPLPASVPDPARFVLQLRERPVIPGVASLASAEPSSGEQSFSSSIEAWKSALGVLQGFRQGRGIGRNPPAKDSRSPAGRSRWPEPDEIRRLVRQHATGHEPTHPVRKFPRALFGLPMIFHFSTKGDPTEKSITLRPRGRNRLASPLIIRPIRDGARFRAMALVLQVAGPDGEYELDLKNRSEPVFVHLTPEEAKQIPPLHGDTSPLNAFLSQFFAKTKP